MLEFNALAKEVQEPFADELRKNLEAEVRAECQKAGITDENEIKDKIEGRVQTELGKMDEEKIKPRLREKLLGEGKFAVYGALGNAMRPATEITKGQDGTWTVTKLVDKNGEPVMKNVSGMDIDKNYRNLVEMYLEDAYSMGAVKMTTRQVDDVKFASKENLFFTGVKNLATAISEEPAEIEKLKKLVAKEINADIGGEHGLSEDTFNDRFQRGLDTVLDAKDKNVFRHFVNDFASAAYRDKATDLGRLVHLIARRIEAGGGLTKNALLHDIDAKASRCAMMLNQFAPAGKVVDADKATKLFARLFKDLVNSAFPEPNEKVNVSKQNAYIQRLRYLQHNGTFFFDRIEGDINHRAAGLYEKTLSDGFKYIAGLINHKYKNEGITSNDLFKPAV